MSDFQLFALCALVALVLVIGLMWYSSRRSTERRSLQERFGKEYDHTVDVLGRKNKADDALHDRIERHDKLELHDLTPEARDRYADDWEMVQVRFVDEPKAAVNEADRLVSIVMHERGYPVDSFEDRADLVSVDHPDLVHHYRAAHAIFVRGKRMEASTEDLRKAVIHYRALFDELLGSHPARG
jgi:hypothetical protein